MIALIDALVWLAFLGDVGFLVVYMGIWPRDKWWRHPMGWHLVAFMLAFAIVLGTSALRRVTGPLPYWATVLELIPVVIVIWWRTVWVLVLKLTVRRRVGSGDEGGDEHEHHDRLHS